MSPTGRIDAADLEQVIKNLKEMTFSEVMMAYRSSDFNLYSDSVMMLTAKELRNRQIIPPEIAFTLGEALKQLREETYNSQPFDEAERYKHIDAAETWLNGRR